MAVYTADNKQARDAYPELRRDFQSLKLLISQVIQGLQAGPVPVVRLMDFRERLGITRKKIVSYAGIPGLAAYAQVYENDSTYDLITEGTAIINSIDAVDTELVLLITDSAGLTGTMAVRPLDQSPIFVPVEKTTVETANLVTALQNLLALLN